MGVFYENRGWRIEDGTALPGTMLSSILFRRITTSALAGIAVWMFFVFFMSMIAGLVTDRLAPLPQQPTAEDTLRHDRMELAILRMSPNTLYDEATVAVLSPTVRNLGPVLVREFVGMLPGPLPLAQSLLMVWPHLITLIALMFMCFAASYAIFMRQEIRGP